MKRAPSCNSLSPRLKSCGRPPLRQCLVGIKAGMEAVLWGSGDAPNCP